MAFKLYLRAQGGRQTNLPMGDDTVLAMGMRLEQIFSSSSTQIYVSPKA